MKADTQAFEDGSSRRYSRPDLEVSPSTKSDELSRASSLDAAVRYSATFGRVGRLIL